jgi:hypothetical protein
MIADLTKGWLSFGVDSAFAAQRQAGGVEVKSRSQKQILASHDQTAPPSHSSRNGDDRILHSAGARAIPQLREKFHAWMLAFAPAPNR